MTLQEDGTNQDQGLRAADMKVPLLRMATLATQRFFRFPVATATGVLLTSTAASLVELIPVQTLWGLFLWLFVSVALGFLILISLVWLSSFNPNQQSVRRSPARWRSVRDIIAASAMVGLLIGLPTVATMWLLPPASEGLSQLSWLIPWISTSSACLGALFPFAVLLPTMIAWPLAIRHEISFWQALHFVLCHIDGVLHGRIRFSLAIALIGGLAAFTPLLCLLVIPWLAHLCVTLADAMTGP